MLHDNLSINSAGHLAIAGFDTVELAKEYGTPCYVMDENKIREMCALYRDALHDYFGETSIPLFASKAASFRQLYRIAAEENIGIDVVSCGELYTAISSGFPADRIYFHGNNKTDEDIRFALDAHIGCFVVDNTEELYALNAECGRRGIKQRIYLRITPGIDPHTHKKIITGNVDSKFGSPIATGQAMETVKAALSCENISLEGLHCHVGSQIFELTPFTDAASIMIRFMAQIKSECGVELNELNLGGGFGVRYVESDPVFDIRAAIGQLYENIASSCSELNYPIPSLRLEPGRSIVAASGLTLYTVGSVKEIAGFRNYVSVDGGMPDNPRYTLYQSQYTILCADRAGEKADYPCTVAGRCCESGDLLAEGINIQKVSRGDILAVLVTGAYNYSMASNYNRIPRPPVVMLRNGESYIAVKRESFSDITSLDI